MVNTHRSGSGTDQDHNVHGNGGAQIPPPPATNGSEWQQMNNNKPPEVSHSNVISYFLPEGHHPRKYIICYKCGEQGHIAYGCPQKGKPKQDIHCVNCNSSGHYFTKCSKRKMIRYQVCNCCGKKGHFFKQCPLQAFLAPQATLALEYRSEEPRTTHQVPRISQPVIRSQVNQISTEEAQELDK